MGKVIIPEEIVYIGEGHIPADYICKKCDQVFLVFKKKMVDDFKVDECPYCNHKEFYRSYTPVASDVAKGSLGNAETKYENEFVYKPSKFGKYKGTKIK